MIHIGFKHRTWNGKYNYIGDKFSDTIIFTTAITLHFIFWSKQMPILSPPLMDAIKRKKKKEKKSNSHPDFSKFRAKTPTDCRLEITPSCSLLNFQGSPFHQTK